MSIHEKQKSCKLFRRIKAGILSAVMFTGSVMANYAQLTENSTMFAAGEEPAVISEEPKESRPLAEIAPKLDYEITLKPNGQWKVTLKPKLGEYMVEIPANIMSASEFDDYRDNIDEVELPYGITKIEAHAFEGVKSLNIVSGGANVKEIGEAAFKGCTYLTQCWIVGLSPDGVLHSSLQTIEKDAFSNSGLTEVAFPSVLTTIGERAFYECQSLKKVDFQENCQVNNFGLEAFGNCKALESVNLENCTASQITFNHDAWKGVFSNCDSLKKVIVPAGASGDISNIFREALSLESITFMENNNPISGIGNIIQGTSVEVLDLSPLKRLTDIGSWQVRADSVTKVIFPSTVNSVGQQAVGDMPALTVVEFKPNTELTYIGSQMFQNDKALVSVNLEDLSNLQEISAQAFEDCESLTSVTIPETLNKIGSNAFNNCKGLIDVKYNAESLTNIEDNIFNNVGYFDLTIGENVKTINARFLSQAQEHISSLKFDGTPTFTITGEGYALNAPFEVGGTYTVDTNGNLYRIEDGSAKLVYANKTAGEITIPEKVGDYTVTGIAKNAFKNSNVTNLTFQKPENITSIEDYAFANAMLLESINGESIDSKIKELFSGAAESTGNNLFYNTKIKNESGTEIKEDIFPDRAVPENHGTAIEIDRVHDDGSAYVALNYSVKNKEIEIGGKFLTGQVANVGFAYNGGRPVRIYIRADENAEINFNNSDNPPTPTGIDGIYYYDVVYEGEKTGIDSLNLSYPNFSAPGSKMQVWAVEFDDKTAYENFKSSSGEDAIIYPGSENADGKYKISDKYFELEWTTRPLNFDLKKIYDTNANPNFIKSSDGKTTLSNLRYQITFTKENATETDINLGSDIVRYVDYTDTLTLPDKLKWRDEINTKYTDTHFIKNGDSGTLYISLNGNDYELFTLSNVPNLVDMSIKPNGDKTYSLCWRLANTSTTAEISVFEGDITFGSEVIVAEGVTAGENIGNITNNVSANEYFTFSQMQEDASGDVTTNFTAPESKLIFKKELLNTVSRMGEDLQYKITVENPSAFAYTGMQKITDNLNADGRGIHYIKPENMQLLFDDEENGDKLTITINNAVLAKHLTQSKDVNAINKDDTKIFAQNTADDDDFKYDGLAKDDFSVEHDNVKITIKKVNGNITLIATGGGANETKSIGAGGDCTDIALALDSIGYIVTASDSYQLEWDYPTDYSFDGGKTMEFTLNTSLKNSLMYLPEKDDPFWYGYSGDVEIPAYNQAELNGNAETLSDKTDDSIQKVHRDLEIRKGAFLRGEEVNETYQPEENDILDYYVRAIHYGSGSYTVLPIVDHMVGRQAVIVEAEWNKDATWKDNAKATTINGVKYYVLNQDYTYEGVYTSEYFYADSIKVTKTDEGLDTLIKYYIENTPEKNFNFDVTYKAINSQEFAGNEKTKTNYRLFNEAWLNDRPGHRIYDTLGLSGSAVEFDKKILIGGMKDNPQDETLETKLPIKQSENKVTYRMMLHSTSPVTKGDDGKITAIGSEIELSGRDIFDMLPLTGTAFDWNKTNVSNITYRAGENGYEKVGEEFTKTAPGEFFYNDKKFEGESTENEWEFTKTIPSTVVKPDESTKDDQQYIKWDEKFKIKLPPQATVYMYVTLTFPGNDKDEEWDKFLEEKGTDTLVNTFYLNDIPAPVSHTLADPPEAFLKKGVYETGSYVTYSDAHYRTDQYYIGKDRFHYSNTYEGSRLKNTVTYYVVLSNTGNTNLYLAPLYDILPPGFSYMALRTGDGSNPSSSNHVGSSDDYWSFSSLPTDDHVRIIAKPKNGDNDDFSNTSPNYGNYVRTKVNYCYGRDEIHKTANGCQILKFEFENDSTFNGLSYDSDKNAYYLKPGQFLQFGYTVYTGDNPITEAENKIVMQYYDPNNTGVSPEVSKNTDVAVKDIHKTAPNNDGDCDLWETEKVREAGFTDDNVTIIGDNKSPKWFESDVTVTREKISPGIKKTVEEPMIKAGEKADWTVTSFNNSTTELSGYTIIDTLDLPLQFEGKFKYSLWGFANDGSKSWYVSAGGKPENADSYLFEITRNGDNITVTSNGGTSQNTTIGGAAVTLKAKTICNKNDDNLEAEITVQISRDSEKHEILTIGFPDKKWDMLPNSCSELTFSTPPEKGADGESKIDPGTYTNTAMFSPKDKNYDDTITQGRLVKDKEGNNVGVDHSAVVSIYTGSPSGSVKMIEEKSDRTNFTTSEREDNYIRLLNKKDLFTYTLEVRNLDKTSSMENLVIIDNLPQQDDATTLRQESKRESEFKVNLAKVGDKIEPNVEVWLYTDAGKLNNPDRIKISPADYGESIPHEVLTQGTDYTVEYSDKSSNFDEKDWTGESVTSDNGEKRWYDTPTTSTRSIRIHFTSKRNIEKNQAIQIRFDAQIDADDENAQPGKIAWNTFGYSYQVSGLKAKASPNKVGICIPGSPTISKKVVNANGKASPVSKDSKFEFIIYKGNETIEFENYTAETVAKTLNEKNIDFMYQELKVEADKSESNELPLENFLKFDYKGDEGFKKFDEELPKTFWKTDETYHIVELDTNKEDYCYKSTNEENNNNYSFKIDLTNNTPLEFVNENLKAPVELPETGGNGTGMFVFGGLMMICLSSFFLLRNKRKHTQR